MTIRNKFWVSAAMVWLSAIPLAAAEHHGVVQFGGLPVPGASVIATQGDKRLEAITDQQGAYSFPELTDGVWTIQVEMLCFAPMKKEIPVAANAPPAEWDLKLLPMDQIEAAAGPRTAEPAAPRLAEVGKPAESPAKVSRKAKKGAPPPATPQTGFQRTDLNASASAAPPQQQPEATGDESAADLNQRAADGFLINGTSNNGASSPFALGAAFGNNRRGPGSLYNGSFGVIVDNSALDARAFSLTGQDTAKPAYNRLTGLVSFGGPIQIPRLLKNGPMLVVNYQWTRNRTATTQPGFMPTLEQRNGDLSSLSASKILNPSTGFPFAGNVIPADRISQQAKALLNLYPLPNLAGGTRYNYQIPIVANSHQDTLQSRVNKSIGRKNQIFGSFAFQSIRTDSPNLFGFLDTGSIFGSNSAANWRHSFTPRLYSTIGYNFSRFSQRVTPYFANRENISGEAGISGNNQEPVNWGPPALNFTGGISALSDQQQSLTRDQTHALSYNILWYRSPHNFTFGVDYRKQQFNLLSQQDPRGTFYFTGAATGSDFADFLLGIPDTSSIAFGNADKYLRAAAYDAYFTDDWRIGPGLTVNAGVRWEYGSPITELYGRLVNLDITPGFGAEVPVIASQPTGALTGQHYPGSLVRPDKHGFQPRVGLSWRPFAASSTIVRAGYGVYYNTSAYQAIATQMAQQAPLSTSLNVQNSAANPLTLANPFIPSAGITPDGFAIDPNFQVGYAQNWQVSVQRDLPASLVMRATYFGTKGTRGVQIFLPNTYPAGAANPCPACPRGFAYMTSNGNSTREAGEMELRRRLHNGITATVQYTYAKAIDDSALGGRGQGTSVIAQNWLDLSAERALSNFDQRHLLTLQAQYTTGMGIGGGTLLSGWRGAAFKEWTVATQISAGTGLPLTPNYPAPVAGTGVTGPIRPDYTGASVTAAPPGLFLNPAAYAPPAPGQWGNAGRNSITGPSQFTMNASLGRTFRSGDRVTVDLRIDAANALNHVTYPNWNTTITSAQFGLPNTANAMRSVQTTLRVRF